MSDLEAAREFRTGAYLLQTAKSSGWPDDGEGALEFMLRRAREVAIEDCCSPLDRIDNLNAAHDVAMENAVNRIEALEAALREIAEDPTGVSTVQAEIARVALLPERDK